jgi:hypothetical protein
MPTVLIDERFGGVIWRVVTDGWRHGVTSEVALTLDPAAHLDAVTRPRAAHLVVTVVYLLTASTSYFV